MILLEELSVGHAFKTNNQISFRCKGEVAPNFIPVIPIDQWFIINQNQSFQPISSVEEYTSSKSVQSSKPFIEIPVGTIIWSGNNFGLIQNLLTTNNTRHGLSMVAVLGKPTIMDATSRILDLGQIKSYNGPNVTFDKLRQCPNCSTLAFKSDGIVTDGKLKGMCYNCKCNINLSWD